MNGGSILRLIGRLTIALIVIFLCSFPFYIGFVIIAEPRWESGVPTDEVRGIAGYGYVAFWVVTQAAIVSFVDRWIRK